VGDPLARQASVSWKITACIPSIVPRHKLLQRAVASVLQQTLPVTSISIAIDNSHEGAAHTRNRALEGASTEWIAFLDDDDEWYPHHLQTLALCAEQTGADVVFPWFNTSPLDHDPFPPIFETLEYNPETPHMFPITTLVRRSMAVEVGGFPLINDPENTVGAGEDWFFWIAMRDAGAKIVHVPQRTWVWHMDNPEGNTGGLGHRW
jgi:glycosyltransferase involved in cell wall biosynthesis